MSHCRPPARCRRSRRASPILDKPPPKCQHRSDLFEAAFRPSKAAFFYLRGMHLFGSRGRLGPVALAAATLLVGSGLQLQPAHPWGPVLLVQAAAAAASAAAAHHPCCHPWIAGADCKHDRSVTRVKRCGRWND
jgi:hypothetical protein